MNLRITALRARPTLAVARPRVRAFFPLSTLALALGALTPPATASEVLVTASRAEEPLGRTLADASVLTRRDIEAAGAASLLELLRTLPGIESAETGGPGRVGSLFVRGTRTAQTLVLVDGVRLENALSGGSNLEFLPLSAIERIEVVRGPSSALYGSGAMGGVIQIFTRRDDGAPASHAQVALGSRGTSQLRAGTGLAFGPRDANGRAATRLDVGVHDERSDGHDITRPGSPDRQVDRDGYRQQGANAALRQRLGAAWQAGVDVFATRGRAEYDSGFSSAAESRLSHRSDSASVFVRGDLTERVRTELRAGESGIDYDYPAFGFRPRLDSRTLAWQNTATVAGARLLAGIETLQQRAHGEGTQTSERRTDSVFGGVDTERGDHQFKLHLRHDRFRNEVPGQAAVRDAATTGSLGWGWRFAPGWSTRASVGSAFRVPTFDDLFNPFGSNALLGPEKSVGWDASLGWQREGTTLRATAFANRIRDAIELDTNFIPQNLDSARIRGLTLEGRQALGAFTLRGHVTLQRAEGEAFDASGEPVTQRLARRARQHGVLAADYSAGAWRGTLETVFQGDRVDTARQRLPGYGVVNLHLQRRLDASWAAFARLGNLTDREFETAFGFRGAPRSLLVGLRWAPVR